MKSPVILLFGIEGFWFEFTRGTDAENEEPLPILKGSIFSMGVTDFCFDCVKTQTQQNDKINKSDITLLIKRKPRKIVFKQF